MKRVLSKEFFSLRLSLYLLSVALSFQVIVSLIGEYGWENVVLEGRFLEWFQVAVIAALWLGLLHLAWRFPSDQGLYLCLAALTGFALVREFNNSALYMTLLPRSWMKSTVAVLILSWIVTRYRAGLQESARRLVRRSAFVMFVLGAFLVLVWAQVLAQRELWNTMYDRLMEETLELAGYFLLLGGVLEEHWRLFHFAARGHESGREQSKGLRPARQAVHAEN
ncbi:MAG: hypothetical protein AB1813_14230 [Verrucomicrobiota bacterium]